MTHLNFLLALILTLPFCPILRANTECKPLKLDELTKAAISDLIGNPACHVSNIESLMEKLPKEFYKNHTLFYRSESLQGPHETDYANPRAIVFGEASPYTTPKLVMTFNGSSQQAGFNSLEFMQFDSSEKSAGKFQFFEISQRPQTNGLSVSESNPAKCVRCHDSPAKPILRTYPFWPGSYGSMNFPDEKTASVELAEYKKFQTKARFHERYKHLPPVQNPTYEIIKNQIDLFGSTMLNGLVRRNAVLISKTPEFEKTKYSILSALLQCPSWPSTVPDDVRKKLETNVDRIFGLKARLSDKKVEEIFRQFFDLEDYREFPNQYSAAAQTFPESLQKLNYQFGPYPEYVRLQADTFSRQGLHEESSMPAALRLLMEGRSLKIGSWFLPLNQNSYHVHEGMNSFKELWVRTLVAQDPDLDKWKSEVEEALKIHGWANDPKTYLGYSEELCRKLAAQSQYSMRDLTVPSVLRPQSVMAVSYPRTFTNTCARCHSDSTSPTPFIPFLNQEALKSWLETQENREKLIDRLDGRNGRAMPPNRVLSPAEKFALKNYLRGLKSTRRIEAENIP